MKNNPLGITLEDYKIGGPGQTTQGELDMLYKAMSAGNITGRDTADSTSASGAPLKVESLENTLKVLTFSQQDIILWKMIPKLPAYNTVEEYNELSSYGSEGGAFNLEGVLPREEDSIYTRRSQLVKFMGNTRIITHPMQLVNTMIGNVIQQEIKNGSLWILRKLDAALVHADSNIIPAEFNGLYAQQQNSFSTVALHQESDNVIDLRGKILNEATVEDACLAIMENHGNPDTLMAPPKVLSDFATTFHESKLIQPNTAQVAAGEMGQNVKKFMSQFGPIDLGFDKFMTFGPAKKLASAATGGTDSPTAPTADATTPKAADRKSVV